MAFNKTNLEDIHRGDTRTYKFVFDDGAPSPTPTDITGWAIWVTFKGSNQQVDGAASLQIKTVAGDHTGDDEANGIMFLTLTSADMEKVNPGSYEYDFQRVIEGSDPIVSNTLAQGRVKVLYDITESTAIDIIPDQFVLNDQFAVPVNSEYVSNAIKVLGINSPTTISVVGGEYSVNGGDYTAIAGTVDWGDYVEVKHTSSPSAGTQTNTILTIGTVSDIFSTSTAS